MCPEAGLAEAWSPMECRGLPGAAELEFMTLGLVQLAKSARGDNVCKSTLQNKKVLYREGTVPRTWPLLGEC